MISQDQYLLLKRFSNGIFNTYSADYDSNTLRSLEKLKYITHTQIETFGNMLYTSEYCLTEDGKSAIETYERTIALACAEQESVKLANEANNLVKETNLLSKKAILRSKISNIIAFIAIIVGIVSIFVKVSN